jgi:uncharacterized protein (DUF1800 family)
MLTAFLAVALVTAEPGAARPVSGVPANPDDRVILHVLNRIGFGGRPGDVARVRQIGLAEYIDRQLHPDRIDDSALAPKLAGFETLSKSSRDLAEQYFVPDAQRKRREIVVELSEQKVLRAVFSERQLEEVMTDFWFNHFNVFAGKGPTGVYIPEYEREAIRPHAFGRFRDLLEAIATSPAMLFYLDNWQSADPNAIRPGGGMRQRPRGLNENYGRELLELHTLGVDGGYSQQDVVAVARAFTGWTIAGPRQGGGFRFERRLHDRGEKVVLGHTIKAGDGREDGERVLDILAADPSTARFISTKLARRFVADAPPAALVDRAARRFVETRGDIREVLRVILTSPEFFAAESYRVKVKSPFEFVVSSVRAAGADVSDGRPLVQAVRQLGMPLYLCQPPTGYADRADAWVNTGALLNRMNFALTFVASRSDDARGFSQDATEQARTYFIDRVLAGDLSAATSATLAKAVDPRQVTALALGSPEFQRR